MCVGGINLIKWKQGNTFFRFVLKGSVKGPFFFQKMKKIIIFLVIKFISKAVKKYLS